MKTDFVKCEAQGPLFCFRRWIMCRSTSRHWTTFYTGLCVGLRVGTGLCVGLQVGTGLCVGLQVGTGLCVGLQVGTGLSVGL